MNNFQNTIVSQYANSPVIGTLIANMDAYIDPTADIDNFYNLVWNVLTAQGFGLDIWGRIVGVTRNLNLPSGISNPGQFPFTPGTYALSDEYFRLLILCKALANIANCTVPSINQLISNLFKGRGRCYVRDTFDMTMVYVFEFYLQPFEYAIVTASGAIPHPVGVQSSVLQVDVANTFGFAESLQLQPFDQGTFYNG